MINLEFHFDEIPTKGLTHVNIGINTYFTWDIDSADSDEIKKFAATFNIYNVDVNFEKNEITLKIPTTFFM